MRCGLRPFDDYERSPRALSSLNSAAHSFSVRRPLTTTVTMRAGIGRGLLGTFRWHGARGRMADERGNTAPALWLIAGYLTG